MRGGFDFLTQIDISDWRAVQAIIQEKPEWKRHPWQRLESLNTLLGRNSGKARLAELLVFQKHLAYHNLVERVGEREICCGADFGAEGGDERFYRIMRDLSLPEILDYGNAFLNDGLAGFFDEECKAVQTRPKKEKERYKKVFETLWRNTAYQQFIYIAEKQASQYSRESR